MIINIIKEINKKLKIYNIILKKYKKNCTYYNN